MDRQSLVIRYVAYALMLAAVVAGLAGLLESDEAAEATGAGGEARVDYPRVTRQGLKPALVVEVVNRQAVAREPAVVLSSRYIEAVQLTGIAPEPDASAAVRDGLVQYRFAALGPGERLRAVFAFSIDQQAPGLRFRTPLRVTLGPRVLLDTELTTLVLP